MGSAIHGRCRRGVRPAVGSVGRPGINLKGERQRFWNAIAQGLPSDKAAVDIGRPRGAHSRSRTDCRLTSPT